MNNLGAIVLGLDDENTRLKEALEYIEDSDCHDDAVSFARDALNNEKPFKIWKGVMR